MPNLNWSKLNSMQLGRYAEYYAKMEFASYGFEVYTSEVDDHGIDFVAKKKDGTFIEVQVKSILKTNYIFMTKRKWDICDKKLFLALLIFVDGYLPEVFLIQATEWNEENDLLKFKEYLGLKSEPEYGINASQKNRHLLEKYKIDRILNGMNGISSGGIPHE